MWLGHICVTLYVVVFGVWSLLNSLGACRVVFGGWLLGGCNYSKPL